MKKRALASWLAFAVLGIAGTVPADAACKLQQQYAAIGIEFDENGGVMVPVRIENRDGWMRLALQTGLPTINRTMAEQIGLKLKLATQSESFSSSQLPRQEAFIKSLILGGANGVNFANWEMYVVDSKDGVVPLFQGRPVIGTLTSKFMSAVDVELNLGQKRINLFAQVRCKKQAVYWEGEVTSVPIFHDQTGLMLFPMEIDGRLVETALNTAHGISRISEKVTKAYFGFDRESTGIKKEVLAGGGEVASYRAMGLTAKELELRDIPVRLSPDLNTGCPASRDGRSSRAIGFPGCANSTPLAIGTDLLKKLRIYIASDEGNIYFTRIPATVGPRPDEQ